MSNIQRVSISPRFTNYDFLCKCPDPDCDFGGHTNVNPKTGKGQPEMHPRLLRGLEKLWTLAEEAAGEAIRLVVVSGARCGPYNRKIGGHFNSQHLRCAAADVQVLQAKVSAARLAQLACQVPEFANGGIGAGEGTVHVDVGHKAFWFYTEKARAAFKAPLGTEEPAEVIVPPEPPADPEVPEKTGKNKPKKTGGPRRLRK